MKRDSARASESIRSKSQRSGRSARKSKIPVSNSEEPKGLKLLAGLMKKK